MPIYEYECQKCGHHLEKMQGINDKPLSRCPKCKGKLEKKWSQTSFQLKGSGWYVTDYAKGSEKKAEATEAKTDKSASDSGKGGDEKAAGTATKSTESTESKSSTTPKKEKKSSSKSAD